MSPEVLALLLQNRQRFLAFLTPHVGSVEAAEEVLQAALLKSVERGSTLREEERAVAWFYRLLRNALIDRYRHEQRQGRALRAFAEESPCPPRTRRNWSGPSAPVSPRSPPP